MVLAPKTRLGTYEIISPLGAGGMGKVYRARDLRLQREIAVKVLPEATASSPASLARLEREARTVAALNHPNIVTLHSIEEEDGVRFLTMELIEGQSLAALVVSGGLPLPRILDLSVPLTDALAAAHQRGVVHRDLKPGNVMVTQDGRVKVLDFGLAKVAAAEAGEDEATRAAGADEALSLAGQVFGTVPYMAPEQIQGASVDSRSDLFSLGIILYELAVGRRPFAGRTPVELGSSILRDAPPPLPSLRSDLPADFQRVVERCLEKDPSARAQTAAEVRDALRALQQAVARGEPMKAAAPQNVASIAVLPFVNRSRDEADEYFSDGLADELLNVLTKIRGIRVAARASSFRFKGSKTDLATIGEKLNVATLLDGSVRKSGNRVRISVQLVKAVDGYHLWSETYDRTLDDIFAVQDDIAHSVVKELRVALLGEQADSRASGEAEAEIARAARGRGRSPEAHRLSLLARHLIDRLTPEDTAKGVEYLNEALKLDPDFAYAWAELSLAYANEATHGWTDAETGFARAREAAARALSLEPDLPEAHALKAWILMNHDWNWAGAEQSFRRALELAPGNSVVLRRAGALAWIQCRFDDSIALYRRAIEQDPLSSAAYINLGFAYHSAGRLGEAEEAFQKALELTPEGVVARSMLAQIWVELGRVDEALAEARREPDERYRLWSLTLVHQTAGRTDEANRTLKELKEKHGDSMAHQIAEVHAARGELDEAFEWLDRAFAERDSGLVSLQAAPRLRTLHSDPRWAPFLNKVGFET
jgi:serine/threonine protein kinase/Tfp pilus assembly protein PilF